MRITNNMILNRANSNINGNKINVDSANTQMTTQKKIDRPSEDPVVAIRSLRLQTSLNKVNQYYEKNIPDATSWMEVTETALLNIKDVVTDMRTLCVQGATGTLTPSDRETILSQLRALQDQVYKEGNADYAGRTVFTGFRTDKQLTFIGSDTKTAYTITEPMNAVDMMKCRYYTNEVAAPVDKDGIMALDSTTAAAPTTTKEQTIQESDYYRSRLSYDLTNASKDSVTKFTFSYEKAGQTYSAEIDWGKGSYTTSEAGTAGSGTTNTTTEGPVTVNGVDRYYQETTVGVSVDSATVQLDKIYQFETEDDWAAWSKEQDDPTSAATPADKMDRKYVPDNSIVIIKETGEMIYGDKLASPLMTYQSKLSVDYNKQGFKDGELRPEYYFDCIKTQDEDGNDLNAMYGNGGIKHDKFDAEGNAISYSIDYTIAQNQTLGVNLEAYDLFDHSIYQDMGDMIDAVERAIAANKKVSDIKAMMEEDQYQETDVQEKLQAWLDLANKEMDYYNDNLGKLYSTILGNADGYLNDIAMGLTKLGCKMDQLEMTEKRMSEQQESVEELKSKNDNLDLSEIILNYTAAYTAYQSSLTAAGKLGQQTLLNYI